MGENMIRAMIHHLLINRGATRKILQEMMNIKDRGATPPENKIHKSKKDHSFKKFHISTPMVDHITDDSYQHGPSSSNLHPGRNKKVHSRKKSHKRRGTIPIRDKRTD